MLNLFKNFWVGTPWFQALIIVLCFLVLGKIITWVSEKYFKKWASKSNTKLDDLIIEKIKPPFSYIMLFVGLKFASKPVGWESNGLGHLINSVVIISIMYIVLTIIEILAQVWAEEFSHKTKSKLDDSLLPIFKRMVKVVVFAVALIWVLKEWGVDVGPFLASLGIAGLAIGFALQDTLKNIFGGVSLILDQSYQVGDKIMVDTVLGEVIDINIRSTKIRTYNNEVVTIPNGKLADTKIQNYVQPDISARAVVDFGVAYGSDVAEVKKVVEEALNDMEDILKDEDNLPSVVFVNFGESSLDFQARVWVPNYEEAYDKKLEATEVIYNTLNKNNINIPFPTRTVIVEK